MEQGSIGAADDLSYGGASHIADVLLQRRSLFICPAIPSSRPFSSEFRRSVLKSLPSSNLS